jgi:uncharacterized protein (DUF488 family)
LENIVSNTIYTLGYHGWTIEQFKAVVQRLDALVVDVRMMPRSRWDIVWRSESLRAGLGARYVWIKQFGNLNYKGTIDSCKIADFGAGARLLDELSTTPIGAGKAIILLCGCRDVNDCHRKIIADKLAALWHKEIVHLPTPEKVSARLPLF